MVTEALQGLGGHREAPLRLGVDAAGHLQVRRKVHRGERMPGPVGEVPEEDDRRPPGAGRVRPAPCATPRPTAGGRTRRAARRRTASTSARCRPRPPNRSGGRPRRRRAGRAAGRASPAARAHGGRGWAAHASLIAAAATSAGTWFATFQVPTSSRVTGWSVPSSSSGRRRSPQCMVGPAPARAEGPEQPGFPALVLRRHRRAAWGHDNICRPRGRGRGLRRHATW